MYDLVKDTAVALEKLKQGIGVKITCMKMSVTASEIFKNDPNLNGYRLTKGRKYIQSFVDVMVYIDPYVQYPWVEIYYTTPVSSMNSQVIAYPSGVTGGTSA